MAFGRRIFPKLEVAVSKGVGGLPAEAYPLPILLYSNGTKRRLPIVLPFILTFAVGCFGVTPFEAIVMFSLDCEVLE